mgnify:CR=1 FL=1
MGPRNTRNARARRHRRGTERAPLPERRGWFIFCNQKNTVLVPSSKQAPPNAEKTASAELLTRFLDFRFSGLRLHCLLLFFHPDSAGCPADSFRAANWRVSHLSVSGRWTEQSDPRAPHANSRFRIRQSSRTPRGLQVTSAARRIASGSPSFHFRRARTRWRTFVTCRRSPSPRPRWRARRGGAPRCRTRRTSPSARSEGCWRRAFRVRLVHGRACASASAPLPTALSDASVFLSSRASPRVGLGRASGGRQRRRPRVHAVVPTRSTIEAFDAAQNARLRLLPLTTLPPDAFVASFRTHPQCL